MPLSILLCAHRSGRSSADPGPADPGLEAMLGRRRTAQQVSAGVLALGAMLLLGAAT